MNKTEEKQRKQPFFTASRMAAIAIFAAISGVLYAVSFPMPVAFAPWLEFNFSDVPVLIGSFALGAPSGAIIVALRTLIKMLIKPTTSAFVGEAADILCGLALAVPAGLFYAKKKTKGGAALACLIGGLCSVATGVIANRFMIIPWYAKQMGMNTLGNWSDQRLFENTPIPYVTSLPEFPETEKKIFRDFPDVLSDEYKENAKNNAKALAARKDDPMMIGYFLRNEPSWAFVDNLVLADEVLYNPERTVCKEKLIAALKEKYQTVETLNTAWNTKFTDFDDLYQPIRDASAKSEAAKEDQKTFSKEMLRAYVEIPSKACREVDPNHMILGMRWAWISDPDLATGWENFDVFSINCYAVDPTEAISHVVELGVDLPIMIGEFHFGALDTGLSATGLEGVLTQKDRGKAYRYYCERVAAHPNGVGCHYFQCYDQFVLGRFDGENYNIGLFDICSRPYQDMASYVKQCSEAMYEIADGTKVPTDEKAESIPMIAY